GQGVTLSLEDLKAGEKLAGLEFTDEQRQQILSAVQRNLQEIQRLHSLSFDYTLEPPLVFRPGPLPPGDRVGTFLPPASGVKRASSEEELAFLSVRELADLIRTKQVSPVELTKLYLDRLTRYGEKLLCVVSLTEGLALEQARRAEQEIMRGEYRSVVHGIPYGVKDLFAVRGYPTTWGSEPHKGQVFDYDATVVEKLTEAGAILVAKLSLGSLAQGDVWFKGRTRNPWNPEQGSSGSSAGSASAVAAGLVLWATPGTGEALQRAGLPHRRVDYGEAVAAVRGREVAAVMCVPTVGYDPTRPGFRLRRAAFEARVPCLTSLETAWALLDEVEFAQAAPIPQPTAGPAALG
ncbi:MAG: hypothetical protein K6U07_03950, partial [Firmicutes bacterium]|nr:hypothetical protein [Bacillota bacterium]